MTNVKSKQFWDIVPGNIRDEVKSILVHKKFFPEQIVFNEGDTFKGFFVVESGKFKLYNINYEGKEAILHISSKGRLIAAPHLFQEISYYPASCEAIEEGALSFFDRNIFKKLLLKDPEFLFEFSALIVDMIFTLKQRLTSIMLNDVKHRLLLFFEETGGKDEYVGIPIQKKHLALILGTTPETLSRSLKILEDDGIISHKDGKYKILSERGSLNQ
ncbi:MAG: Crp/Fnr family transcriptional regulator [Leptospiraceae bacterium]|nr:Crp/Fnr family transcriptional regulator [Leptospiraceae bacterium]MCK6380225.1 Crp/Fnr family transcriptional regulator [Leptospiraceae bacterium]NUM41863.1 Crp/Fnr family transcriptional regulator [Leptospiraceae bacterium]